MLTLVVYAVLALIVVSALVVLAVVVLPATEQLAPAPPDRAPWSLPADRAMAEADVSTLRLPVTLRGYRFAETDAVLDRLGEEIAYRDQVIAMLRAELDGPAAAAHLTELGETPEETDGDPPAPAAAGPVDDGPAADDDDPVSDADLLHRDP